MVQEGFRLVRTSKHFVWSDGRFTVVTAASPSDRRAFKNVVSIVRRLRRKAG